MESSLSTPFLILIIAFLSVGIGLFVALFRTCRRVTSFQGLLEDLASGKEKNFLLRWLLFGSNGIFKGYYEWQLRMVGDRVMTGLIQALGYVGLFAAAMTTVSIGVIWIVH